MKFTATRIALAAILVALVMLAGLGGFAYRAAAQLAEDGANLARVQRVLALLATLQTSSFEAESALRGHALNGDPTLLETFRRARDSAGARLAELRTTDAPSAERYERMVALGALLAQRFDGLAAAVELRGRGGPAAVAQWETVGEGQRIDTRLRAAMRELMLHAEAERQGLQQRIDRSSRTAQGAAIACSLGAVGIAGIALWRLLVVSSTLQRERESRLRAVASQHHADSEGQHLYELATDAVCSFDAEGRIVRVSAAGEKLWGWAAQDLVGKPALAKTLPEDHRRTEQALAAAQGSSLPAALRNRWKRKDGSIVHLQWVLQGSAGDRPSLGVARDVTELERLRLAVPRQTEALRAAGVELRQAIARADAAQSAQSVFVAAVEQALKPLAESLAMRSAPSLHGQQPAPEAAQRQRWTQMHDDAQALQEVIADVLDFGALEAGQVTLGQEAFDVWEALSQAAAAARTAAERKGLALRVQLDNELGYARGDTRRVEQVLRRLLHEAIAATDAGVVSLQASRPRKGVVRIEVHDGALLPGDPAALFATDAPAAGGQRASVGLMLSQRLAKLMGGELAAAKAASQGRVFTLTLPADDLGAAA